MKKISMIITVTVLSSILMLFTSCEDPVKPDNPIDESKPVVKQIVASTDKLPAGNSIEVQVVAEDASSYAWSAPVGEFADPTASSTTWTSSGVESSSTVKLECAVSNGSGSRMASVTVAVVVLTTPLAYWPLDTDKADAVGSNDAVGDVGIVTNGQPKVLVMLIPR